MNTLLSYQIVFVYARIDGISSWHFHNKRWEISRKYRISSHFRRSDISHRWPRCRKKYLYPSSFATPFQRSWSRRKKSDIYVLSKVWFQSISYLLSPIPYLPLRPLSSRVTRRPLSHRSSRDPRWSHFYLHYRVARDSRREWAMDEKNLHHEDGGWKSKSGDYFSESSHCVKAKYPKRKSPITAMIWPSAMRLL